MKRIILLLSIFLLFSSFVFAKYIECSENSDCFLNVKDTTYIDGKNIALVRVGSANAVIVDVDGALETISANQIKTIYSSTNNIEIKNKETFFEDYDSPSNAATLIISLSKNQNISNFKMVWKEDNIIVREEPFYPNEDMCNGYRCLKGNEVSPACYNLKECKEVCDRICWNTNENEAIVTEKVQEVTKEISESVIQKPIIECNGCLDENNNCIPVTVRISNKFCVINKELKQQLSGESPCNNNYECDSNVCVSNKCISTTFLEKIIGWFKKIFG